MTRQIPEDKQVIGMYANTSNAGGYIGSLGFILWNPDEADDIINKCPKDVE